VIQILTAKGFRQLSAGTAKHAHLSGSSLIALVGCSTRRA